MTDRELMQQALDTVEKLNKDGWILADFEDEVYASIEALRARLTQPEPEPVAWLYKKKDGMQVITDDPDYADGTWIPLYTAPPKILCGCGDQIMPNDGAECGNCVAARNA